MEFISPEKLNKKWHQKWKEWNLYQTKEDSSLPKFYCLDMFPYPSGAGLHVGHPLGYIASDIVSRYKRLKGFNVLHPMGFDAFGLPAEQYALQTGKHPANTTSENIQTYKKQLDAIGLSFDWSREVQTCSPDYYKWTQWAFIQLFNHYFCEKQKKALPISFLISHFENHGSHDSMAYTTNSKEQEDFSALEWKNFSPQKQSEILLEYRLAFLKDTFVNWCPELKTVLANDEVKEGLSIRGGYPVEQKKMKQWCLRITAYASRLLEGLHDLDWSDSLKETQRNWIGQSHGMKIDFLCSTSRQATEATKKITVFTTRPETLSGVSFLALAPEHPLVLELTKESHKEAVWNYLEQVKKKSERERIGALKEVSGCFIGEYVLHPLTQRPIPIWISDYVLVNYGTGAIMGVPAHDERDERFARHFSLPIENLPFLREEELEKLVKQQQAEKTTQYKIRDAIFSRQRYWGEPIPIYYKEGIPTPLPETSLPLLLPNVSDFRPTEEGSSPLGRLDSWKTPEGYPLETSTMPGFAGSCAYSLRYMSPKNSSALVSKEANTYWQQVDLYVGGSEHATGHLLYSRFWNHFLYDIGAICQAEPFKKLLNQGMIQGRSQFCYRLKSNSSHFVSFNKIEDFSTVIPIHVPIEFVQNDLLNLEKFKAFRPEYKEATFTLDEKGHYVCGYAVEKMSKSLLNVCNPDTIIALYGADVFRLYEMFLGPITQSKPWNTDSIEGVDRFLKKFQRLFYTPLKKTTPTQKELQILHKVIFKVTQDIENFSFNTAVSALMIAVNDLTQEKCCNSDILKELTLILAPFTPFICEEIWEQVFQEDSSIFTQKFPEANPEYLKESTFSCPVSINGKLKFLLEMPKGLSAKEMEEFLLNDGQIQQYLKGPTKKIIAVPDRIINIVA